MRKTLQNVLYYVIGHACKNDNFITYWHHVNPLTFSTYWGYWYIFWCIERNFYLLCLTYFFSLKKTSILTPFDRLQFKYCVLRSEIFRLWSVWSKVTLVVRTIQFCIGPTILIKHYLVLCSFLKAYFEIYKKFSTILLQKVPLWDNKWYKATLW